MAHCLACFRLRVPCAGEPFCPDAHGRRAYAAKLVLQLAAGGVAEFIVLDKFVALSKLILRFLNRYKTSLLRKHLLDVLVRSLELT